MAPSLSQTFVCVIVGAVYVVSIMWSTVLILIPTSDFGDDTKKRCGL